MGDLRRGRRSGGGLPVGAGVRVGRERQPACPRVWTASLGERRAGAHGLSPGHRGQRRGAAAPGSRRDPVWADRLADWDLTGSRETEKRCGRERGARGLGLSVPRALTHPGFALLAQRTPRLPGGVQDAVPGFPQSGGCKGTGSPARSPRSRAGLRCCDRCAGTACGTCKGRAACVCGGGGLADVSFPKCCFSMPSAAVCECVQACARAGGCLEFSHRWQPEKVGSSLGPYFLRKRLLAPLRPRSSALAAESSRAGGGTARLGRDRQLLPRCRE